LAILLFSVVAAVILQKELHYVAVELL